MTFRIFARRFLKIISIILGAIVLLLAIFYWWFVNHAETAIEEIVALQSKGKVRVEIGSIKYNYGRKFRLRDITFYTADSLQEKTAHRFTVKELNLRVRSFRALLLHQQLLMDSILIQSPDVTITRLVKGEKKHISLPEEMGGIYNSIHKALSILQVQRFEINDARFTLADKTEPDLKPITISRLSFYVDNFKVDSNSLGEQKFLFSDNVILHTDHQQFVLPDGKHHISFRMFRINIMKKLVEIDSCTIVAQKKHGTKASFTLFADTLKLTNLDFLALSREGIIRADSVYCANPDILLDMELDSAGGNRKKPVNVEHALHHLATDMQLGYIGVKNAQVHVITTKNNQTNNFTTKRNNFELFNVQVDTRAEHPISVERFLMAIRYYEGYGQDSAYRIRFDSINFTNDKIQLNNFSITTAPNASVNVRRDYHMPLFELQGFSWPDLIFNRHLKAQQAILHEPVLNYTRVRKNEQNKSDTTGKKTIYEVFEILDTLLNLQQIQVINGTLNFQLNPNTRILLQQVNGIVNTNELLQATSSRYIEQSVDGLSFSKGTITAGKLHGQLSNVKFDGNSRSLVVGKLALTHPDQSLNVTASRVLLNGVLFNDSTKHLQVNRIAWHQAKVKVHLETKKQTDDSAAATPEIILNNINGANTQLELITPKETISTFIYKVSAKTIARSSSRQLRLLGLDLHGRDLQVKSPVSLLQLASYQLTDGKRSTLQNLRYEKLDSEDTISIAVPAIHIVPHLDKAVDGTMHIAGLEIQRPLVKIVTAHHPKGEQPHHKKGPFQQLQIDRLEITQPVVSFKQVNPSGAFSFGIDNRADPSKNDKLAITNIRYTKAPHEHWQIGYLHFTANQLQIDQQRQNNSSLTLAALGIHLEKISFSPHPKKPEWAALIKECSLQELRQQHEGPRPSDLYIQSARVNNLPLSAAALIHWKELAANNPSWSLADVAGYYKTDKDDFRWHGVHFNAKLKTLSLDSFSYTPVPTRDAFIAAHPFQTDYIKAKTGLLKINHIDLNAWFGDSVLKAQSITIEAPSIAVFRDKHPPFQHGIIKPLPVGLLKKIPFKLWLDSIHLSNMQVEYAELSEKTNKTGTIHFTRLNASLFPMKNYNITPTDSLRLRAQAYLLDTIWLSLRMRQSYTDTLGGFLMNANMAPADLTLLNPVLQPLASVKLQSGTLDTMTLRAIGREYVSLGEMKLFYKNLRIQFLKQGEETQKKGFLQGLMTFVANQFVLKKNNSNRTGIIYFPRLRDRSVFNYWIKMTLSGAATSVGAKSNKKALRKYRKEIKHLKLPPIDL